MNHDTSIPLPRIRGLVLALAVACSGAPVLAMDCPAPPVQSRKDWDVQVRAEVGRIGMLRGAELDTRVRGATQDLMGKLPDADKLYLEQMMFAAYCSALRDDAQLPGAEKSRQILEYRRALQGAFQSAVKASR